MPRKRDLLNVRSTLEFVERLTNDMLERDGRYPDGLVLAPIDQDALKELRFIVRATLKKHAAKKTRKDLYVEASNA